CKLDLSERKSHAWAYALHRDLLRLRREDPVLRGQGAGGIDGAVFSDAAFLIRLFGAAEDDRLLLVNLGRDLKLPAVQEPLIAPPAGTRWSALWCSEDPRYGGLGSPSIETREGWRVHGQSLVLLGPTPIQSRRRN
ncbi:MAG TPA: DUF3459 domain-containing protein, partial [Chloroflexota bacterium]